MLDVSRDELTELVDDTVAAVLRRAGVRRPPVDAVEVAGRLGYRVLWDDAQQGRARIAEVRGLPGRRGSMAIFLRRDPRPQRVQWAVAHELGEACTGELFRRLRLSAHETAPNQREQLASTVATRLLLPTKWFARDSAEMDYDLSRLKARYATASHELIARRWLDLRTPVVISVFDHGKLQFRRWNLPGGVAPLTAEEHRCWRRAHESSEAVHLPGPPRIDVWAVHEPDWKREIVRLEPAGEYDEM
jgi:hypothetical protein